MSDDPIAKNLARQQRNALELATTWLKATKLFGSMSRRLLFDLVERNGVRQTGPGLEPIREDEHGAFGPVPFLAIVVLKGTVRVRGAQNSRGDLRSGVYLRSDDVLPDFRKPTRFGKLVLDPTDEEALVVTITASSLADSPTAAWSLDLNELPGLTVPDRSQSASSSGTRFKPLESIVSTRGVEYIWVSAAPDVDVPIGAAMHVLGAGIARMYAEMGDPKVHVVLFILGAQPQVLVWWVDHFQRIVFTTAQDLIAQLGITRSRDRFVFLFGNPGQPTVWPGAGKNEFHRIVHLTKTIPESVPAVLRDLLRRGLNVRPKESHFSSFIASVVVSAEEAAPRCLPRLCDSGFDTMPLPCGLPDESTRLYRDACVLRVDTAELRSAWQTWVHAGKQTPPFIDLAVKAIAVATRERWARAVTNRRVGVALSGGGASAYRSGPLLRRILDSGVPIDVVTALSGGALIGAFFCHSEIEGFELMRRLAPLFQLTLPGVYFSTLPMETNTNALLGHARVEHLETRFAAVAVALPDYETPRVVVVRAGTIGEAVRVSGALPPSFAPVTKKGIRYTDGGAGCLVPAQAARDCGADLVLACNLIPGPSLGNPAAYLGTVARLLRWTPYFGRLIDSYTWSSFSLAQGSREYGLHADVFVEFAPQPFPAFESTLFAAVETIIEDADGQGDMLDDEVGKLVRAWMNLKPPLTPRTVPRKTSTGKRSRR